MSDRLPIFVEIQRERARQDWLRDQGKFSATLADKIGPHDALSPTQKLAVITEEVGEIGRAALAIEHLKPNPDSAHSLRVELIQLAALTVAWLEALPDPGTTEETVNA